MMPFGNTSGSSVSAPAERATCANSVFFDKLPVQRNHRLRGYDGAAALVLQGRKRGSGVQSHPRVSEQELAPESLAVMPCQREEKKKTGFPNRTCQNEELGAWREIKTPCCRSIIGEDSG